MTKRSALRCHDEQPTIHEAFKSLLDPLIRDPDKFLAQYPALLQSQEVALFIGQVSPNDYSIFRESLNVALDKAAATLKTTEEYDNFINKMLTIENEHRLWSTHYRNECVEKAVELYEKERARIKKLFSESK